MFNRTPKFHPGIQHFVDAHETYSEEDTSRSIPERFESMVKRYPQRVAVETKDDNMSYAEMNATANRTARAINDRLGGSQEAVVALVLGHGTKMLVAILAVLKAEKVYVVLDPTYPGERLQYMFEDSGAQLIVTEGDCFSVAITLCNESARILNFEEIDQNLPKEDLCSYPAPESLAMLLYTSGSTGKPKGVTHTHQNVLVDVRNLTNLWKIGRRDRFLLYTSCSFANSVRSIFTSLMNGASIYPWDISKSGFVSLPEWLRSKRITVIRTVPTTFRHFVSTLGGDDRFDDVRIFSTGGESVTRQDVDNFNRYFSEHCIFVCSLGPTECLTVCSCFLQHGSTLRENKVPIGYSLPDKEVVLVDSAGNQVADGDVGEITIRSRFISPGYWRNPELSKHSFRKTSDGLGERIYLTGDLATRDKTGLLRHVGRKDDQVKIRGYRIETAEIEEVIRDCHGITETVVIGRENLKRGMHLVAYFVKEDNATIDVKKLRCEIASRLPYYMMPAFFMSIPFIPTTPNGKTDRRALPPPNYGAVSDGGPITPCSSKEAALIEFWKEVFHMDSVGAEDSFICLGGDSLQATRIAHHIESRYGVHLMFSDILRALTIRNIAQLLDERLDEHSWVEEE